MESVIGMLSTFVDWLEAHEGILTGLSTLVIAAFTIALARSTKRLWQVTGKEFVSTNRPKIIVRSVSCTETMGTTSQPLPLQIDFVMANSGGTPATVREISATLMDMPSNRMPPRPPYGEKTILEIIVKVGEPHPSPPTFVTGDIAEKFGFADGAGMAITSIYCLGYVVYVDSLERGYRTAFLRRYNASTKRFDRVDDPDYEYQD